MQDLNEILQLLLNEPEDSSSGFLSNFTVYPSKLIEQLSIYVARLYYNREIEFGDGDYIMNLLYGYWYIDFSEEPFGDIAEDCFNAFDEGEYYHTGDDPEIDPAEKYTRPSVAKILGDIDNAQTSE